MSESTIKKMMSLNPDSFLNKSSFSSEEGYRIEADFLGEIKVPQKAMYGVNTQRAINNFNFSNLRMPKEFLIALALIKKVAAQINGRLGCLDHDIGAAIMDGAQRIIEGQFLDQFPIDVFQTGSGTSTNMNINEILAKFASLKLNKKVSPNDHVNLGQSSNDVIPTAIHLSAALRCHYFLLPHLKQLAQAIEDKAKQLEPIIKTGRTHLMDAMPLRMSQELGGWACQIRNGIDRVCSSMPRIYKIAQGGAAVGTGVNTHPNFGKLFAQTLREETGIPFVPNNSYFESLSSQDAIVELSGQLKVIAVSLMKISNDLRWMNSGPLFGLGEIKLKALQAGSSIMPGKVNPVIPEAVMMAASQVIGNDTSITIAGQSGNFQLNTMLPIIAYNILQSISLIGCSSQALVQKGVLDFTVNEIKIQSDLNKNPILVTALNPIIGYEKAAEIAHQAYSQNRALLDVAAELTQIDRAELEKQLDPKRLV